MLELTVRLVASLAVVVGLLLLLARFGGRRFRGRSGDLVRVVHRQPLTRTSAVAVVAVGNRILVLGTTEQQVSILTELDPAELGDALLPALEEAEPDTEPATTPGSSFAEQLVARTATATASDPGTDPAIGSGPVAHLSVTPRTGGAHRAETTTRAPARTSGGAGARVGDGALVGSVLSAQTWRQALAAATGKAS